MKQWNVVVTVTEHAWREAKAFAAGFGQTAASDFHDVLLLNVADIDRLLADLAAAAGADGKLPHGIAHVYPLRRIFSFATPREFESKARAIVVELAAGLAGKTFHARVHRRGFKGKISSHDEERMLDTAVLEASPADARPRIRFDDPDAVIDVELVGNRAGMSLWTRDELRAYPFIRID